MAGKKITELLAATAVADEDLLPLVRSANSTPTNEKITVSQILVDASSLVKGRLRLTKDLSGTANLPIVSGIQGVPVDSNPPVNGDVLRYNGTLGKYIPTANMDALTGHIETPVVKSYILDVSAAFAYTINSLALRLTAGSAVVTLKVNGVAVSGITAVSASTSVTTFTANSGAVTINSLVELEVISVVTPSNLAFTLRVTK
jgi:hypothetical protein